MEVEEGLASLFQQKKKKNNHKKKGSLFVLRHFKPLHLHFNFCAIKSAFRKSSCILLR